MIQFFKLLRFAGCALLAVAVSFFLSCNELERIEREARRLFDRSNKILTTAIGDAARMGMVAVNQAYDRARDPALFRFVAKSTATTLADQAVKIIITKQLDQFDKIFGVNHSAAVGDQLLMTYCYPILNDIIEAAIELKLQEYDATNAGIVTTAELDSIVVAHLKMYDLAQAIDMVKALGVKEKIPEYFSAVGVNPVNTATYASTRNWKDNGLVYQYRIADTTIEMRRSDGEWQRLTMPAGLHPRIIAANNNRLLVLTHSNELWWYCVKRDQVQWSIDVMNEAVKVMALKPELGSGICSDIVPLLEAISDSVAVLAASNKLLQPWADSIAAHGGAYWSTRCAAWSDMVLSIDKLLLKSDDGQSFTADDYLAWSHRSHQDGTWANLLTWSAHGYTFHRGSNIPLDSIVDIAVGHWNGTVVTMYAIAREKIWFIDEEVIHPEWKPIEQWNTKWAIIAKEYEQIGNAPYPLDATCRIDAANSVVAVVKKGAEGVQLSWIRWDYHQKDDFIYWPLDWCEHAWHTVICPSVSTTDFRLATMGTIDPRDNNTVWSVPAPTFTVHTYLPQNDYKGIFGDIPRELVSAYPVTAFIKSDSGTVYTFTLDQAKNLTQSNAVWSLYQ